MNFVLVIADESLDLSVVNKELAGLYANAYEEKKVMLMPERPSNTDDKPNIGHLQLKKPGVIPVVFDPTTDKKDQLRKSVNRLKGSIVFIPNESIYTEFIQDLLKVREKNNVEVVLTLDNIFSFMDDQYQYLTSMRIHFNNNVDFTPETMNKLKEKVGLDKALLYLFAQYMVNQQVIYNNQISEDDPEIRERGKLYSLSVNLKDGFIPFRSDGINEGYLNTVKNDYYDLLELTGHETVVSNDYDYYVKLVEVN